VVKIPLGGRRDRDVEFAQALVLREYETLREEVFRSYEYGQGIVRWSIGAYGAIFAAGLLAGESAGRDASPNEFTAVAALVIFGLVLPGLICAATWTWLGELTRAERAGAYLRAVEHELKSSRAASGPLGHAPLRWETYIHDSRKSKTPMGKQVAAYLGTAGLFVGGFAVSIGFAAFWRNEIWPWRDWNVVATGATIVPVMLFVLFLGVSTALGRRLLRLGDSVPRLPR
jgi:hypothetical protein